MQASPIHGKQYGEQHGKGYRTCRLLLGVTVSFIFLVLLLTLCSTVQAQPSLQERINLAHPHDTILVQAGEYHEQGIIINKALTLLGVNNPVIDAQNKGGDIIQVTADSVHIIGITVRNVAMSYVNDNAAIKLNKVRDCSVQRCTVQHGFFGIYLARCLDCRVLNNECSATYLGESQSGNGIHLWTCTNISIENNHVTGHRDGIYFEFVRQSHILSNLSEHNFRYGLHFMFSDSCTYRRNTFRQNGSGVAVMYTKRVVMTDNRFENNWGATAYGLLLKDITDSYMSNCVFYRNTTGIYSEGTARITIEHCDIIENGWAVKIMANSMDDYFTANNFIGNTFDVATNSSVAHSRFEGNYWSSYGGYDVNHDGVGDVPYAPVRLSAMMVEKNPPALMLLHSLFVSLLDMAERVLPSLTPDAMMDDKPAMKAIATSPSQLSQQGQATPQQQGNEKETMEKTLWRKDDDTHS